MIFVLLFYAAIGIGCYLCGKFFSSNRDNLHDFLFTLMLMGTIWPIVFAILCYEKEEEFRKNKQEE